MKDFFRTKVMYLYVAKSLHKGGRVALLSYIGITGSSMAVGPGKVTVLSNLLEEYVPNFY